MCDVTVFCVHANGMASPFFFSPARGFSHHFEPKRAARSDAEKKPWKKKGDVAAAAAAHSRSDQTQSTIKGLFDTGSIILADWEFE